MANILIIGDSQAGNPGEAAKRILVSRGHTVTKISHSGCGPLRYVTQTAAATPQCPAGPVLWNEYVREARGRDVILLIFGHNNLAGASTAAALEKMKRDVRPPVMMSGPPQYPNNNPDRDDQAQGAALRAQNQRIFGDRYIDAWPSTPPNLPRDAPGWHLTLAGAQGWGEAMADAVEAFLAGHGSTTGGGSPLRGGRTGK